MCNRPTAVVVALLSLAVTPAALAQTGPAHPPFENFGRANELAQLCRDSQTGFPLSIGACLALSRENATNETATFCAFLRQNGYFPIPSEDGGEPIATVAQCVAALSEL